MCVLVCVCIVNLCMRVFVGARACVYLQLKNVIFQLRKTATKPVFVYKKKKKKVPE